MTARWAGLALVAVAIASTAASRASTETQQKKAPHPAPVVHPVQESLPDPTRAIIDLAHRQAAETEKKALASGNEFVDTAHDPKYAAAYTDYAIWILDHDRKTYEWNHTSSIIIFYMVMFLVLSGIWFSWMQFRIAHHPVAAQRTVSTATATPVAGGGTAALVPGDQPQPAAMVTQQQDSVTEFSASPQGIKVASSAIGVVILVISMCFFYLYLDKVYPITVMPSAQAGSTQGAAAQSTGK
jgi:hypothetical protein